MMRWKLCLFLSLAVHYPLTCVSAATGRAANAVTRSPSSDSNLFSAQSASTGSPAAAPLSISGTLEVQARQKALTEALLRGDPEAVLACYSERYRHEDGETKADLREHLQWYFQNHVIVRIETLAEQYLADAEGSRVTQTIRFQFRERDRETRAEKTVAYFGIVDWAQERSDAAGGRTWRIVSARNTEDVLTG